MMEYKIAAKIERITKECVGTSLATRLNEIARQVELLEAEHQAYSEQIDKILGVLKEHYF